MSVFSKLFGREAPAERVEERSADDALLRRLDDLDYGRESEAGTKVTTNSALEVTAVFACVRVLAEGVAGIPLHVYRTRRDGATTPATTQPIYKLLHRQPNPLQSSFEFRETMMLHAALAGDAFAFKMLDGTNAVRELWPLEPGSVNVELINGRHVYTVSNDDLRIVGRFGRDRIFHLPGPSWNLRAGMSAISLARNAIGLGIATEKAQSKLFANGARPGGVLATDQKLSPDQAKAIQTAWDSAYSRGNAYKTALLDGGFKYSQIGMTGVDSQSLETRKHQIEEVCRVFNVFPQMIMQSDKSSTYASAEAFFAAHVRHTLRPWLERWEQAIDRDLLTDPALSARFDTRELTKASAADREKFYRTVTELGIYTRNEIRELEGLEPLPGLSEPLTPANMTEGGAKVPEGDS